MASEWARENRPTGRQRCHGCFHLFAWCTCIREGFDELSREIERAQDRGLWPTVDPQPSYEDIEQVFGPAAAQWVRRHRGY